MLSASRAALLSVSLRQLKSMTGMWPSARLWSAICTAGFAGDFAGALPAADAAQRFVDGQSLDHRRRGRQAQYRLGDKSPRQGAAILGLAAASVARRPGHVGRQPDRVEHDDQLLQGGGDRVEFLAQRGEQRALDVAPPREYIIAETSHATTLT